ncbi:uncharacterized protein EV154DRAFT_526442 [Mucor mucedo]|uniref:uncharacterized protein n=1 Tax=Mucor mucedo TaxID=29922 RepID=UPI00221EB754|nr:uncharacterized protein EV154DRAFT_526442 [Mucor mucedo]KAI7875740.1 hypothetical protein EV154DRAFT_526442 [Mucor mucedo]
MRIIFLSVLVLLCVQGSVAFWCELLNNCPVSTTPPPPPAASATPIVPQNSTSIPAPTVITPPTSIAPSSTPPVASSTTVSSIKPSSISSAAPSSVPTSMPSSTFTPTTTSETSTMTSATPSATPTNKPEESSGSNIGVIVGSVCGFIAIIGAGFAYAFFSKTRRNNRDKRLYSQSDDNNYGNGGPQDLYSRPSPALAASAAAAANNIHGHNQYDNNTSYNYAPQTPMVAVAKHDPYYSTAPVSQMGYPTSDPYYNNNQQQYYDPNAVYYDPQQQHYDPHYVDSQKHQYEPYAQHQSPVLANNNVSTPITTSSNVYSVPHSYSNEPNNNVNHR